MAGVTLKLHELFLLQTKWPCQAVEVITRLLEVRSGSNLKKEDSPCVCARMRVQACVCAHACARMGARVSLVALVRSQCMSQAR